MKIFPIWWTEDGACACPAGVECLSPGKHPLTRNGVKDATDTPAQIDVWREQWPDANWAIATGNGLLVVDLDVLPGKDGRATFAALGKAPKTRVVRTGSGGLHLYFTVEGRFPNTAGKVGLGIDTRGDGGYVLAPGSGHVSGGSYSLVADVDPSPAPEWLIERLGRSADVKAEATDRGYFPPAPPEVLQQARAALDAHGPAIQGEGGDLHTMHAAAILTHDFALSEDEAWDLFQEWNLNNQPPWNDRGGRIKLRNGQRYGKLEYGCRRSLDVVEIARKLTLDWQATPNEPAMFDMLARVRKLPIDDEAKRGVIVRELKTATGLTERALAIPRVRAIVAPSEPGTITVTTRLSEMADQALKAIAPKVFVRNGILCEVIRAERVFIHELESARIQDLMGQSANWTRQDEQRGAVSSQPPERVATILQARRTHPGVRVLEAVTTAPVFLPDGSILERQGYSQQARVWLEPSVSVDVPDEPTQEDAAAAVSLFADLLCDFKFQAPEDFSSWMAGVLSPLVKAATGNAPAPLICVSASSPGAGKTLLTEVIARIVTGGPAEVRPYNPRDPGEWGKRITAFVKAASPVSVFDNCNGPIGDEAIDRLITSATWSDRLLGASDAVPLPNVTTWLATGNNIEPVGDTVRRVLICRIIVDTEKPQERTGFRYVLPDAVDRSRLLSAALTILRAYHVAGRPDHGLPSWGSFTAWSALIREALVFAGCADPYLTQARASRELNEPENEAHDFWLTTVAESDGTPGDISRAANAHDAMSALGLRDSVTPMLLKRLMGRFIDRPRSGRRLRRVGTRYVVETIA